jgi:hypothetical protein
MLLGAVVGVLCVLGVIDLAGVPRAVLRAHPFSSFVWLLTLACCGVTAEALWNRRPWRLRAATSVIVAAIFTVLANMAEWAWAGRIDDLLPMVPQPRKWIIFFFVALIAYLIRDVRNPSPAPPIRRRVPGP